jgi:hypothetical protein
VNEMSADLVFASVDAGCLFLRNVRKLLADDTALHSRGWGSTVIARSEILKFIKLDRSSSSSSSLTDYAVWPVPIQN